MKLYNSLTRKVEIIKPEKDKRLQLFVCGPTVYDRSHIGHARTYLSYDALVKFMRLFLGWDVTYLQNITNIDDKIIRRAKEEGIDSQELAQREQKLYVSDMASLSIDAVDIYAPATDYIPQIVQQVEGLLKSKHAYAIESDGIYFDITTFAEYGKLSGRTVEQAEDATTRIDESVHKRNKGDFALWKFKKEGEPSWEAPFGVGRPGWHIEDTAIAHKHFGYSYDMHGGAVELSFPHHEAEIAQMESLSDISPMVRYWVHTGVLTINGEKMSKSEGNVVTIHEFLKQHSPQVLRMFVFSSLYRSPVDWTEKALQEASARQERLQEFVLRLQEVTTEGVSPFPFEAFSETFWDALKDDFNTPKAFAELFQLVTETNRLLDAHTLSKNDAQRLLAFLGEVNAIFNILTQDEPGVPEEVSSLIAKREEAREEGRYEDADVLREAIRKKGFDIKDTDSGTRVTRV